jgi:hypothetical protein
MNLCLLLLFTDNVASYLSFARRDRESPKICQYSPILDDIHVASDESIGISTVFDCI